MWRIVLFVSTAYVGTVLGRGFLAIAFGDNDTKEVYCYDIDLDNMTISPCTDEEFIATWGNSDALGL